MTGLEMPTREGAAHFAGVHHALEVFDALLHQEGGNLGEKVPFLNIFFISPERNCRPPPWF